MLTFTRVDQLRPQLAARRAEGKRIALVPTMGNLHDGHYSLIARARELADVVVASVFVNPTQFGPNEDFSRYPRSLAEDQQGLERHGCDLLFAPEVEQIYPYGVAETVRVEVPGLGDILEGASRPGHFTGVATVVTKLFNLVAPDVAVFGQKDYQQLLVIRRLTRDLGLPIAIVAAATQREPNGLARSSRNQYLSATERATAAVIHRTLLAMAADVAEGLEVASIEQRARVSLEQHGLRPDYAVLRQADDLAEPRGSAAGDWVALIAAKLGTTRLIDNLLIPIARP